MTSEPLGVKYFFKKDNIDEVMNYLNKLNEYDKDLALKILRGE